MYNQTGNILTTLCHPQTGSAGTAITRTHRNRPDFKMKHVYTSFRMCILILSCLRASSLARRRIRTHNHIDFYVQRRRADSSFNYKAEGDSWKFQTEIKCADEDTKKKHLIIKYNYALETRTKKNLQLLRREIEFHMLEVAASDLCRNGAIKGVYSSLPMDRATGKREEMFGRKIIFLSMKLL